jgi:L-erythro-3,5-diaminohexanoate dehydrogenase
MQMDRLGTHRSLEPRGVLPQQAQRLDVSPALHPDEIAIDVEWLNVDSASWRQLRDQCGDDPGALKDAITRIVAARGKLHNPVTGSGGMLIGRVSEVGNHRVEPQVGTRIATLVSLTLTPLVIDEILELDPNSEKVRVKGRAILFGSGIYTEVPDDLPLDVVLGVLDVAGAPAWMAKLAAPGMRVVIIGGGGKSGMLAAAQAVRSVGPRGRVIGLCWPEDTVAAAKDAGAEARPVDCTDAVAVAGEVTEAFAGELADLVFVCANVPDCEGGAIAACSENGEIVFFSMATSFTAAALTAEGLGKACRLTIGNGYLPGHAELALDLIRAEPRLLDRFS